MIYPPPVEYLGNVTSYPTYDSPCIPGSIRWPFCLLVPSADEGTSGAIEQRESLLLMLNPSGATLAASEEAVDELLGLRGALSEPPNAGPAFESSLKWFELDYRPGV